MNSNSNSANGNDGLRERILRASITLIEEEGLAALSVREVARRAGVSHQAPYHHFADREAILAALAERGFAMLGAAMQKVRRPGVEATEAVERGLIAYIQFACDYPAHFRIMFRPELVELAKHAGVQSEGSTAFRHVPEIVVGCMKAGFPESFGVELMSALFWSTAHGLASLLLDGPIVGTLPDLMKDQEHGIAQVAHAMRLMVEATINQELAKRVASKSTRAERHTKRRTH